MPAPLLPTILPALIGAAGTIGASFLNRGSDSAPTPVPGGGQEGSPNQGQSFGSSIASAAGGAVSNIADAWAQQQMKDWQRGQDNKLNDKYFAQEAQREGKKQRAYFDAFAPNTTEWERLGATSSGTAQIEAGRNQNETALKVANIQAASAENVARIQAQAPARQASVAERNVSVVEEQMLPKIQVMNNEARLKYGQLQTELAIAQRVGHEVTIRRIQSELERERIRAGITRDENANIQTSIANAMEGDFSSAAGAAGATAASSPAGKVVGAAAGVASRILKVPATAIRKGIRVLSGSRKRSRGHTAPSGIPKGRRTSDNRNAYPRADAARPEAYYALPGGQQRRISGSPDPLLLEFKPMVPPGGMR